MKIKTAFILCAGFGKRLNPLTLKTPKPLLKINNLTLLENTINLIKNLDINKIILNTFHLKEKIKYYIEKKNFDIEIEIIEEKKILDTGGGILNMIQSSPKFEENYIVFNPDTVWNTEYLHEINQMIELYFEKKANNILLLVNKDLSFDKDLNGDFGLKDNLINKNHKDYIYTGCQIINRSIFINEYISNFSVYKIWSNLIKKNQLSGFESRQKFYHINNLEVFKKLKDL